MKRFKIFSILFCCLAAVAFTSCLNDDNEKGLTPEEKHQAFLQINGNYDTKIVYYSKYDATGPGSTNKLDTLAATMKTKNDSVMQFELPSKALVTLMKDATLSQAIVTQYPMVSVNAKIGFYKQNPPAFLINPEPVQFNVNNADGSVTDIRIVFAGNYFSSFGAYNAEKRTLGVNLIIAGVYRNSQIDRDLLPAGLPVLVVGKRR